MESQSLDNSVQRERRDKLARREQITRTLIESLEVRPKKEPKKENDEGKVIAPPVESISPFQVPVNLIVEPVSIAKQKRGPFAMADNVAAPTQRKVNAEEQRLSLQLNAHKQNVQQFQSKLDQDLQDTQQSLIKEMKDHGLLANINVAIKPDDGQSTLNNLMKPLELHLQECFTKMRDQIEDMAQNKNYFAMSLKIFFIELSNKHPDLLELMCHNYVHQWVNKEVANKPKVGTKYGIEARLEHIKKQKAALAKSERELERKEKESERTTRQLQQDSEKKRKLNRSVHVPKSSLDDTASGLQRRSQEDPTEEQLDPLQSSQPRYMAATLTGLAKVDRQTMGLTDAVKQPWKPSSGKDQTLEQDHRRMMQVQDSASRKRNADLFGVADLTDDEVLSRFGRRALSVARGRDEPNPNGRRYSMFLNGDKVQLISERSEDEKAAEQVEMRIEKINSLTDRLYADSKKHREQQEALQKKYEAVTLKECTFVPKTTLMPRRQKSMTAALHHRTLAKQQSDDKQAPYEKSEGKSTPNQAKRVPLPGNKVAESAPEHVPNQSQMTARTADPATAKTPKRGDSAGLFDYLSSGRQQREIKIKAMQEKKQQEEMAACTFQPKLKRASTQVAPPDPERWGKLAQRQRNENELARSKKEQELRDCTFKPRVDPKSMKIAKGSRDHLALYKEHKEKLEKQKSMLIKKETIELNECTFKPTISKPPKQWLKKKASSAADLDLKFKTLANPKHHKNKPSTYDTNNQMPSTPGQSGYKRFSVREDVKAQRAKEKKAIAAAVAQVNKIQSPERQSKADPAPKEPNELRGEHEVELGESLKFGEDLAPKNRVAQTPQRLSKQAIHPYDDDMDLKSQGRAAQAQSPRNSGEAANDVEGSDGQASSFAFQNIRNFIEKSKQPSKYIQEHNQKTADEIQAKRLNTPMHRNRMAVKELVNQVKTDAERPQQDFVKTQSFISTKDK